MKAWIRDLVVALALAFIILQFIKPGKFDGADFARWRLHISEQAVIYIR